MSDVFFSSPRVSPSHIMLLDPNRPHALANTLAQQMSLRQRRVYFVPGNWQGPPRAMYELSLSLCQKV